MAVALKMIIALKMIDCPRKRGCGSHAACARCESCAYRLGVLPARLIRRCQAAGIADLPIRDGARRADRDCIELGRASV
jgi:hypothetical protein